MRPRPLPVALAIAIALTAATPAPAVPIAYDLLDLGSLGGGRAEPFALNDYGEVVGQSATADGRALAFRTGPDSPFEPLADDLGLFDGWDTAGYSLNDAGWVVGYARDRAHPHLRAIVFDGLQMLDLNDFVDPASGWHLASAADINASGQIVGVGYINGGLEEHAFLLTPRFTPSDGALLALYVPEPATFGLLAAAGLLLLLPRRRA